MKINQLSIFLENKTGRINEMCNVLTQANINMKAFSLAESAEFGIMRIIVSDAKGAKAILKEKGFTCSITEVICLDIADKAGELNNILDSLSTTGIFIDYMYAFSQNNSAKVVIKPTDIDGCIETLSKGDFKFITSSDLF